MPDTRDAKMLEHLKRLEAKVDRLDTKVDVQIEHVRDDMRRLGESFGGTLEHIDRRLLEILTEVRTNTGDHDLVLRDHGGRITALERRRS
jgi:hypothetical protein